MKTSPRANSPRGRRLAAAAADTRARARAAIADILGVFTLSIIIITLAFIPSL